MIPARIKCLKKILKIALTGPGEVFEKKESFKALSQMASEGKIQARQLDLTDSVQIEELKTELELRSLEINTLYVSNIIDWIKHFNPENEKDFYNNITLLNPKIVIDSACEKWGIRIPQRIQSFEDFISHL